MADAGHRLTRLSATKRTLLERRLVARRGPLSELRPLPRHEGINTFRTSFAQERLWVLEQVAPGNAAYTVAAALRAEGHLDRVALRRSLTALAARHESLRTTFGSVDGVPLQVISPFAAVSMPVVDCRGLRDETEAATLERARLRMMREVQRPFDLAHGPLLRVAILLLADDLQLVCVTMHHLIADGWSVPIVVRELAVLYGAFVHGHAPRLPEVELQYADYAQWQRERFRGDREAALVRYWRRQLRGASYPWVTAADRLAFRGAAHTAEIAPSLAKAARVLSRREGVTLFVTMLAVWRMVVGRVSGDHDVTILSPVANRERPEVADVIGFFVNLVALRIRVDGDRRFREVLRLTNGVVRDAQRHQELPFEMVLRELGLERTLARPPLSPIAFALERIGFETIALPGLELTPVEIDTTTSKTDLALFVCERRERTTVRLEYSPDLHDAGTAARIVREFVRALEQVVADPDRPVSECVSAPTTAVALRESVPAETVWERIAARVAATPAATAVRAGTMRVTYRELSVRAAAIATTLAAHGVARETPVAVWGERGVGWVCAMLGIFRAGVAYLPLDPLWPAARVAQVLRQSGAGLVLTGSSLPSVLAAAASDAAEAGWEPLPIMDGQGEAADTTECETGPNGPSALAYVIYTSGSSGTPKGAMIEHAGLLNHLQAKCALLGLNARDRVAQTAAAGFDISVWQCLAAILAGGTVEVIADAEARDPRQLRAAVARTGVTVLEVVPAVLRLMLEIEDEAGERGMLGGLRWLVVTGEALAPELCRTWLERYPGIPLVNAYGPTECSDDVTHHVVRTPPAATAVRVPIGKPIAGMTVHVLDEHLTPVSDGAVGELCVSGIGVGRGYWRDAARTAAAFVSAPQACGDVRLYRTGDLGRRLPDGTLECLGRLDEQVKIRGMRVEPGDVEAVLRQHPVVRDAAVVARTDRDADSRLVAYLAVSDPADAETVATLRRFVAARLPAPMVPSAFVPLSALPLTVNGKIDRQALVLRPLGESGATTVRRPPATAIESLLAEIWSDVLHVESPAVDDNFFALGGDSLSSIQVVAQARRHGFVLRPQDLFEHQTIACLAAAAETAVAPRADQGVVVGTVPLTPIQRLFFAGDLPDPRHYNMSVLLEVPPSLDPSLLAIAVEHLLRHHDALRLRFRHDGAEWRQVMTGLDGAVPFTTSDLSGHADDDPTAAIASLADQLQGNLDLTAGPIFRVAHLGLGPDRPGRLLLVAHHLVCDVVSWPFLLEDLGTIYQQLAEDEPIALPAKTSSFRAWAERLVDYGGLPARAGDLAFWRRECADQGVRLPLDAPAHVPAVADMEHLRHTLGRSATAQIMALAAGGGTSMEGVLLAAFATAVTGWAGGEAVLVYLERHGREALSPDLDLSRTVGWFTAVFPVRVEVAASRRPADTLALVTRHLREIPDGGIGFGVLRSGLSDAEAAALMRALPQPETSFNYLGRTDPPERRWPLAPESAGREVGLRGSRPTLLDVTAHVSQAELHVDWAYDATLHHRATIEHLAEGFRVALQELAAIADREGTS